MEFYSPFTLTVDPMERLLLINITADPDEVYIGFEPQVFDDPTWRLANMISMKTMFGSLKRDLSTLYGEEREPHGFVIHMQW